MLLTEIVYCAPVWPCVKLPVWDLSIARLMLLIAVGSSSVLGVGSPPPETVPELVTLAGALLATSTVSVMSG